MSVVDPYRRAPIDDRVRRERRHAHVVMDLAAPPVEPPSAAQQLAPAVRRRAVRAHIGLARDARHAFAARRQEGQHDAVAGREQRVRVAGLHDGRHRLVPERHRQRARAVAVDHRQVGVAQSGGVDAHEQLAGARRIEIDRRKRQRRAPGIRGCAPCRFQNRSDDPQRTSCGVTPSPRLPGFIRPAGSTRRLTPATKRAVAGSRDAA